MSLLGAHLEAPLSQLTKPSGWNVRKRSVTWTSQQKPGEDPSISSFRQGLPRSELPKMISEPFENSIRKQQTNSDVKWKWFVGGMPSRVRVWGRSPHRGRMCIGGKAAAPWLQHPSSHPFPRAGTQQSEGCSSLGSSVVMHLPAQPLWCLVILEPGNFCCCFCSFWDLYLQNSARAVAALVETGFTEGKK